MSNWNKIGKPIVVLCLICVVITGALAATNSATAPVIKAAEEAAAQAARTELLPEATGFTLVEGEFEGVMTDKKAREAHVGGEVLAFIW